MRSALGPILVSLALVGAMGVVHGIYSDRWGRSTQLEQALVGLSRVPATVGDWVGEDRPLDAAVLKAGDIQGSVSRRYRNPRTGEAVSMLIVCGRGGPISVHTPDVCYEGAGYRQLARERRQDLDAGDGRTDSFNVARFGKPGVVPVQMEIYWAWSIDGVTWQAPENPRLSLARSRALYKMYVVREFAPGSRDEIADTCEAFLRRVLPELRQALPPAAN
jgi:hypothetical protein